ncbi:MAG: acetyl-CoA carboxylase biotin carboxyl carrier protein [Bauldia sp.]
MSDKKSVVDQDLIRQLAKLLDETGLTEIEVEQDKSRIRVARMPAPVAAQVAAPAAIAAPLAGAEAVAAAPKSNAGTVLSPMVGTAFLAPEPGAKAYVEVGDRVREGQTLLIIEAMKTMNQIPAPRAGVVTSILVEDSQPVEYGEPLLIVE